MLFRSPGSGLVRLRHLTTDTVLDVPEDYLYERDGTLRCDDFCDYYMEVKAGERVELVETGAMGSLIKKNGVSSCSHYGLGPDDAALIDWRRQNHRVVTGNDVWLGHNAVLMGGVTLGDGAVVGAGAVVTHDVAPYEIVGGVPARHIGWRYPPELIAAMERIRWWDWSHDMLRERLRDFDDAAAFCRKFDPQ